MQESLRVLRLRRGRPRRGKRRGGRPANGTPARRLALLPFDGEGQRRRRPPCVQEEPHDRDQSGGDAQRPDLQHHGVRLGAGRPQPDAGEGRRGGKSLLTHRRLFVEGDTTTLPDRAGTKMYQARIGRPKKHQWISDENI